MSSDNPPPAPKDQFASTMPGAVSSAYGGIQNFSNMPNTPQATFGQANSAFGGPTWGQSGYDPAGAVSAGNWMAQQGQSMSPYISQIFAEGFDPQNAAYGRASHDLQEQVRASQGARGIQMTPYGAGLEDKAFSDFNIDWRDRQLGRQTQAASAGAGLADAANRGVAGGQQVAQGGGQWQAQIAEALSRMGLAGQVQPQQAIQDWLAYTQQGSNSANNRFSAQMQGYAAQQQADAAMWQGIGSLAGSAAGAAGAYWG